MANKYEGWEVLRVDSDTYKLKVDFGFLSELEDYLNENPIKAVANGETFNVSSCYDAFIVLHNGRMPVLLIAKVIEYSLKTLNNNDLTEQEKETESMKLMTAKGLQEASALAQVLLTFAMVGDEKKQQELRLSQQILAAVRQTKAKVSGLLTFFSRG